jgi:hypothetical protein
MIIICLYVVHIIEETVYIFLYDHSIIYINIYLDDPACKYLIIRQDLYYFMIVLSIYVFVYELSSTFGKKMRYFIYAIVMTWLTVERLGSYVSFMNLLCKIDVLTINLFFLQLSSLGLKWITFEVLPPICIIEQG